MSRCLMTREKIKWNHQKKNFHPTARSYSLKQIDYNMAQLWVLGFLFLLLQNWLWIQPVKSINWTPTPFPAAFSISFLTNITSSESTIIPPSSEAIQGMLYYDWTIPAQRIDHGAGSYECVHFYQATNDSCSLVFTKQGMYRFLGLTKKKKKKSNNNNNNNNSFYNSADCCLDLPSLGPPSPTWALQANPTFQGLVWDEFAERLAWEWWFENPSPLLSAETLPNPSPTESRDYQFHTVREVAFEEYAGYPLVFTFPGSAQGRQDYHFQVDTMIEGAPSKNLFDIPNDCLTKRCSSLNSQKISKE